MIRDSSNRRWLPVFNRFEPVNQDSTAMRLAKECYRKYFYRIVLGLVPKNDQGRVWILDFGTAYHKFREVLDIEWLKVQKGESNLTNKELFSLALKEGSKDYAPKIPPTDKKALKLYSPERLLQCCYVSFVHWEKEKAAKKIEVIAIEQPIQATLPDGSLISGRADQIVRWTGRIYDRDFKTTSKDINYWKRGLDPNDQATRYIYALGLIHGEPIGGVLFEVMLNIEGKPPEIVTVPLSRSKQYLELWEKEQLVFNRMLDICREEDVWPMADTGVGKNKEEGCQWCDYKELCASGNDMSLAHKIQALFIQKPWRMENVEQKIEVKEK